MSDISKEAVDALANQCENHISEITGLSGMSSLEADTLRALRAALDEAEDRIRKICLDALISYGQVEAERDALAAQLDAANALLRDGLLSVQTWRNEPIVNWAETVAAHLGAKP